VRSRRSAHEPRTSVRSRCTSGGRGRGRPAGARGVDRGHQGQTVNVVTTERFYDFGTPVDIQLPAESQVTVSRRWPAR
jgi:hypothetical protein